jgi:primosomal protein N'
MITVKCNNCGKTTQTNGKVLLKLHKQNKPILCELCKSKQAEI